MTKATLLELIASGENSEVEFKRDAVSPEALAKEIVALANFQGGRVLIGVDDNGAIGGIQRPDLEHWLMNTVFGRIVHPLILPHYEEVQVDGRHRVAVVTVNQGVTKPYVVRRKDREDIYVRVGSTSRLASREQQARLYSMGGMLHTELLPVSGSGLSDLSLDRLSHYIATIVGDTDLPATDQQWEKQLCGLGFMVDEGHGQPRCTIAGLALFGRSPRRLLRHSGIRWMSFAGTDKEYQAQDDRVMGGPLVALRRNSETSIGELEQNGLIEDLIEAMRPFVSQEGCELENSLIRKRRWEYPKVALREAIVNALAHRDWTRYEEAEVVRYGDRLEVLSPGALQNSMTVEKMLTGQRSARNPLIVDVLRDYGYVEARGMGVRKRIVPLIRHHNGTEPEFVSNEDHVKLVLHRAPN